MIASKVDISVDKPPIVFTSFSHIWKKRYDD
jgi:hypothetical protein